MTAQEKGQSERAIGALQSERRPEPVYESLFRQCLRCEAPVMTFVRVTRVELARAAGRLVTPVLTDGA